MTAGKISAAAAGEFRIGGEGPGHLRFHRLGFGAMRLTGKGIWGEPSDRGEAIRVLRRAVELDVNFIDTADSYGPEVSERLIAEALYPYPHGLVIATKGGLLRPGPDQWVPHGTPEHLRAACEGSLERLRVERIDLYQLHRIDPKVPTEDQLGTLLELQTQGKIKHIGLSEVTVGQIEFARTIVAVETVQNRYSVSDQSADDVVNYCEQAGIGFIPWFPLAAGELSAPGGPLDRTAAEFGITPAQLALAWLLWRSPVMLPIPGTSKVPHLEENVAAAGLRLDQAKLRELGELGRTVKRTG
ncbi:MAG: pyridoxine 4-dehydrogenase [Bryobacterales bacterium]|nr:pyridoxine 4-dehydrogenase [Bryobacterales bacterium]